MAEPDSLDCEEDFAEKIGELKSQALTRQFILTRRDILRYIAVRPQNRAEQVNSLLNLSELEAIRATLVTTVNQSDQAQRAAAEALSNEQTNAAAALNLERFDGAGLLAAVNENRQTLGVETISELKTGTVLLGISRAAVSGSQTPGHFSVLKEDMRQLGDLTDQKSRKALRQVHSAIAENVTTYKQDPRWQHRDAEAQLIQSGLELLGDATTCPLCDVEWSSPESLRGHLEENQARVEQDIHRRSEILKQAGEAVEPVQRLVSQVGQVQTQAVALKLLDPAKRDAPLLKWKTRLQAYLSALQDPLRQPAFGAVSADDVESLLRFDAVDAELERLATAAEQAPAVGPEDEAHSRLIRFHERLRTMNREEGTYRKASAVAQRARMLHDAFLEERDAALQQLYDDVSDRFVEFYQKLHDHEGETFQAALRPTSAGAGLDFSVEFHGRGSYPPTAVHSEGHQDSMGLCLFLALAEKLEGAAPDIIVLDDVWMSVDQGHREQVCALIQEFFADTQFFITTHDKTWMTQLRMRSIVPRDNLLEFPSWSVETGPIVNAHQDMWDRIERHLEGDRVSEAALALRRGAESFFEQAASRMRARVSYRGDYRWDLGDWMPGVSERYKELLNRARRSARSWQNDELLKELDELESVRVQIMGNVFSEQWDINPSIHWDRWIDLTPKEFLSVSETFQSLIGQLTCPDCGTTLAVASQGTREVAAACDGGHTSWNLQARPDQ